jgi:hypothetical protein
MKVRRFLLALALSFAVVSLAGYVAARQFLPPLLSAWVAGPDFHRLLSQAVSHALKVEGTFGAIELQPEMTVATAGFTSTGWPGQAIGALNAGATTGRFDPWAILRGQWRVDLVNIASAEFKLVAPDNALKAQDPVIPPKPWYGFLMPSQFFCQWIECPDMTIELPVGQTTVRGTGLHLGAMMIGKNFKYFGKNGQLSYPGYADLAVDAMEVYVTREVIDIGYLYLREPASPQSNLQLSARLGQHADKSIKADAIITSLDIAPFLPADIAEILAGQLHGRLTYATDTSGGHATGQGTISLANASLQDWEYLDHLAEHSGDPSLRRIHFQQVSLDYALEDDLVTVSNLAVRGTEQIDLRGAGTWNMETSGATASLTAERIPLGAYLPASIGGQIRGALGGSVDWAWRGIEVARGHGGGTLQITGGQLDGFKFQKFLDRFLKSDSYAKITIQQAGCTWKQDASGVHLENLDVLAPGQAGLRGSARLAPDGSLSGTVLAGLPASSLAWLPEATTTVFGQEKDGLFWATIELSGTVKKPENNFTAQVMYQLEKHPLAMAELALRGLSWWLGDILGTAREG